MANIIVTYIEITGQREVLEKIYDAIEKCNDVPVILEDYSAHNWVGNIFNMLYINSKRYSEYAFWDEPRFNKYGHLVFREKSASERSHCAEILKRKFPYEITGINYMVDR